MGTQAAGDRIGSYDPAAVLIDFRHTGATFETDGGDGPAMLRSIPPELLAHELAHYLQATSTAAGIWQFVAATRATNALYHVLRTVGGHESPVTVPLIGPALLGFDHDDVHERFRDYCTIRADLDSDLGGQREPAVPIPGRWWTNVDQVTAFGIEVSVHHPIVNLDTGQASERVHVGFRHLAEGSAKVIELARIGADPQVRLPRGAHSIPASADPYFVALALYQDIVGSASVQPSPVEFVALCDLAMILHPGLLANRPIPEELTPLLARTVGPGDTFTRLCQATTSLKQRRKLLRRCSDDLSAVTDLQDALLRSVAGPAATSSVVTALTSAAMDQLFDELAEDNLWQASQLPATFHRFATRVLGYRQTVAGGGAVMTDLLGEPEATMALFRSLVPAYSAGTFTWSSEQNIIHEVAEATFRRDIAEAIAFGDGPCPWATGRSRTCALPEQPLCERLRDHDTADPCPRLATLQPVLRVLGPQPVDFGHPGRRDG